MDVASPSYVALEQLRTSLAGRYRIDRELGRGGMAVVFLAEDIKHGRQVAIKILRPELTSEVSNTRFLREIQIASRLTHPNLLPLHDSGDAAGCLYFVMPYVDGESLRDLIRRKKQLPLDEALRVASDAADGLEYAHRQGVLHRDIKPENILLQGGRAIVADFGIARAFTISSTGPGTSSGVVIGTATYMSPEQGHGARDLDARSDVYSLGCVLYEMLAGEPPFTGPTPQAIVARHVSERLPSLRVIRPDLPPGVESVVNRALAKVPADRFQSAEEFAAALRHTATTAIVPPRSSIRPRVAAGASLVLLGGIAFAVLAMRSPLRQDDWILVADFTGPGDDPQLGPTVRDLATQGFKQSRYLRVFDRRQLNDVMRRANIPETTLVDGARARELAMRSSIRAILQGAVRRMDSANYEVVIHVVKSESGEPLASTVGTGTSSQLPLVVDNLVANVRRRLGERRAEIASNRPIREVATPSFEAFRKYTLAMDRVVGHGDVIGGNHLIREAIAVDSGFASAWAMLGANYVSLRQLDSARWAYDQALSHPTRLSAAELYRLKGDVAYVFDHDRPAAIRWYDLMLAEAPHSSSGHNNRALYKSAGGDYAGALADLQHAVSLNPFGARLVQPTLLNLGAILVVLGRLDDAREIADSLTDAPAGYLKTMIATAASDWAQAESLSRGEAASASVQGLFRINAITSLAGALASGGQPGAADSVLRVAAAASRGATARWYERARLLLAIAEGRAVGKRTDLVPLDTTPAGDIIRGFWAAVAGDTLTARASLATAASLSPSQLAVVGHTPALTQAWISGYVGEWRQAVALLAPIATRGEHDPTFLDRADSYLLRWSTAIAYARLGNADSSTAYIQHTLLAANMPPGHFALRGLSYRFAETWLLAGGRRTP